MGSHSGFVAGLRRRACVALWLVHLAVSQAFLAADEAPPWQAARKQELHGQYAEAADAYEPLRKEHLAAALGMARCQQAQGQRSAATATLKAAIEARPADDPATIPLLAQMAQWALERGDSESAERLAASALKLGTSAAASWVSAEVHRTQGKLEEAEALVAQIVTHYEQNDIRDIDELHACGLAAAQHARWKRRKGDFQVLVNDLYPLILSIEPDDWRAHYQIGLLFLEKYNEAEASRSLKKALQINPSAAEVYAAIAQLRLQNFDLDEANQAIDRALALNPELTAAHRLRGDALAANFQLTEAIAALEKAAALNPVDEATLGRMAACFVTLDGPPREGEASRFSKLRDEVIARNPAAGSFFLVMADQLSDRRRFSSAEAFYKEALLRHPQLVGPHFGLGMLYMRLGKEPEAEKLLSEAYEIDPFNVRCINMLKVLEVLSGYAVIETEHFVVKFDRGQDEALARMSADYLEQQVYPELTRQFGFEPEGKSLFEIFNKARNTGAHGWFSARMVGLPYVGTVGACAGKMVAMASPNGMDTPFNWARVLKHEFVHVLNLQQTNFNIPHWFTEALAVINENYPRPQVWNELLADRVPRDELFHLDNINLGFIRPSSSLDWQMAYCQAELYAEYLVHQYGKDALAKMLQAYADNLETKAALQRSFGVAQEDFETGYRNYLKEIVAGLSARPRDKEQSFAELERAWRANKQDGDVAARLAEMYVQRKAYPKARELAQGVLNIQPQHPLASCVLAKIHLLIGEEKEALALLEGAFQKDAPDSHVVQMLAGLRLKAKDHAGAAELFEAARQQEPLEARWVKGLAKVYLATGEDEKLRPVLETLTEMDADDLLIRKKLLQLATARGDDEQVVRWSTEVLWVNAQEAAVQRARAEALQRLRRWPAAVAAFETYLSLKPRDSEAALALAAAQTEAGDAAAARKTLEKILEREPDHAQAQERLKALP